MIIINRQLYISFGISTIISFIIFSILQGLYVDQIDEFINRDISQQVINNITILNYITFSYSIILILSFAITINSIIKNTEINRIIALSLFIAWFILYPISYFILKYFYPQIIGFQYFLVSQGLFMVYILNSQFSYFAILIGIFIFSFIILIYKEARMNKNA